ncbi:hypothetical protein V8D89_013100 [Ganoderma adspersum]
MKFIRDIERQPRRDPADRVHELSGQSDNINHQFGGNYVWLVPKFTPEDGRGAALTGFNIVVQKDVDSSVSNLAKGAAGDNRYLLFNMNAMQSDKVTEVALFRTQSAMIDMPSGWTQSTTNINEGRAGAYLYLLWKSA